jgi:hypothetical protein
MRPWPWAAVCAAFLLVTAMAGSTARSGTDNVQVNLTGNTLVADFHTFDPQDPCLELFGAVVASDTTTRITPGPQKTTSNAVMLVVVVRDVCLDDIITFSGSGDAPAQQFKVASNLTSASVKATVPVFDVISFQSVDFQVNLSWTATGPVQFDHDVETFRDPDLGLLFIAKTRERRVDAVATGTLTGVGENFAADPSDFAEILKANDGSLVIQTP